MREHMTHEHIDWGWRLLGVQPEEQTLQVEPAADGAAALPYPEATFDKVLVLPQPVSGDGPQGATGALLKEVRRVLKPDGQVAVVQWPVMRSMYRVPFHPRYDDLVQTRGDALRRQLGAAGFGHIRLRFKPTTPIASVCVLGTCRVARDVAISLPLLFGGYW